jgi:hypothetical protein
VVPSASPDNGLSLCLQLRHAAPIAAAATVGAAFAVSTRARMPMASAPYRRTTPTNSSTSGPRRGDDGNPVVFLNFGAPVDVALNSAMGQFVFNERAPPRVRAGRDTSRLKSQDEIQDHAGPRRDLKFCARSGPFPIYGRFAALGLTEDGRPWRPSSIVLQRCALLDEGRARPRFEFGRRNEGQRLELIGV